MESDAVFYCTYCYMSNGIKVPLKFKIIETTEWDAEFKRAFADEVDDSTKQTIPTFEVETGEGVVEWEPKFVCPVCKQPAYVLNRNVSYNEDEELLYINDLEAELAIRSSLGKTSGQRFFKPAELPKIQRPSQCSN